MILNLFLNTNIVSMNCVTDFVSDSVSDSDPAFEFDFDNFDECPKSPFKEPEVKDTSSENYRRKCMEKLNEARSESFSNLYFEEMHDIICKLGGIAIFAKWGTFGERCEYEYTFGGCDTWSNLYNFWCFEYCREYSSLDEIIPNKS